MNAVDIAVIAVLLVSGIFALMRGFVYEVLAMAGWVLAGLAALWGEPFISPLMRKMIGNPTIAEVTGGAVIFVAILIISSFITHTISLQIRKSFVSAADRSLGFVFGLARGLLAASLAFIVVNKLMAPEEPDVLVSARSRPLLEIGARAIQAVVPNHIADIKTQSQAASDVYTEMRKTQETFDRLNAPKPKQPDNSDVGKPVYDEKSLERLIETNKGQ